MMTRRSLFATVAAALFGRTAAKKLALPDCKAEWEAANMRLGPRLTYRPLPHFTQQEIDDQTAFNRLLSLQLELLEHPSYTLPRIGRTVNVRRPVKFRHAA